MLLDPYDVQLQLPGHIGLGIQLPAITEQITKKTKQAPDVLTAPTMLEKQANAITQAFNYQEIENASLFELRCQENLECVAQECPELLKRDLQLLFPQQDVLNKPFVAITFCQRTKCDMSAWSYDVEEEREELMEDFFELACTVCNVLQDYGHFADFIDPSSGTPHLLQDQCPVTLFETDERYRWLGFQIDDLGCCKVLNHYLWGNHAFIGTVFTTATLDHPLIKRMLKMFN